MAITTYSELQSAVADWLNRSDLTARIPDFITLAETRINRDLRAREQQVIATANVDTPFFAIPGDFLEFKSFRIADTNPRKCLRSGNNCRTQRTTFSA